MNYLQQLFPWYHPHQNRISTSGGTGYCSDCTTTDGLPGARVGSPQSPCRAGYGCTGGGAVVRHSTGLTLHFSNYSQSQLNDMATAIATLQKKYDDSVADYNNKKASYDSYYAMYGNCDCSHARCDNNYWGQLTCNCNGIMRSPQEVTGCSSGVAVSGRTRLAAASAAYNSAKSTMDVNKVALDSAKASYNDALAQFEREKTANMTPAEKAAYEASKAEQARKDARGKVYASVLKYAGISAVVIGAAGLAIWGGKKLFKKSAPVVVAAAA